MRPSCREPGRSSSGRAPIGIAYLMIAFTSVARPDDPNSSDAYLARIKPILAQRCYSCHGAVKQEGDLRLDTVALIQQGGESGPAIVAGKGSESRLVQRIQAMDEAERMPPEGSPLKSEQVAEIVRWIDAGASAPLNELPEVSPKEHWAFQPPVRVAPPSFFAGSNWLDAFIDERLAQKNLTPLGPVSRTLIVRRLSIDLIGLPPTPEEVNRFERDPAPDAHERVVDRLLADPRYGERWGRHWMDVWRYSDWYGRRSVPDVMNSYPHIWRWRDWIVRNLNTDRSYASMIAAMLAADEISPGNDEEVVATGFLVRNWFKWNYENWMKDNVEHTSKAFLGLTLNCSHCHDHKYDPLSQVEYFRFRAFFEPLELRQDRVPGLPDPGPFQKYVYAQAYGPIAAGRIRVFDEKLDAKTYMYAKGDARLRMEDRPPVEAGVPAILGESGFAIEPVELPPEAYYPGLTHSIREEEWAKVRAELDQARQSLASLLEKQPPAPANSWEYTMHAREREIADRRVHAAELESEALAARIAADDARYFGKGDPAALASNAFASEKHAAYARAALRLAKGEAALLQATRTASPAAPQAGDEAQKEVVAARTSLDSARAELQKTGDSYTPLSPIYPKTSTGRRRALARWITSPTHPLTARVAVNHLWHRHFGRGIVDTLNNFGRSGHPPSHRELLDALALELVEHDWQMKHLHRLMVTSTTYRRQSHIPEERHDLREIDPENRWLARMNQRRMEAEVVRDSLLSAAGLLDTTLGGQEVDANLGEQSHRRSLYFASHGEGKMLFLETFDAPDVCDSYDRTTSVRPQQALALSNSLLSQSCAQALAESILKATSNDAMNDELFVDRAFECVLSRPPLPGEREAAIRFLKIPVSVLQEGAGGGAEAARVSLVHALFNHHDFVTIR